MVGHYMHPVALVLAFSVGLTHQVYYRLSQLGWVDAREQFAAVLMM